MIILVALATLIVSGCNNSDNKTMNSQTIVNETKTDSTTGYALVNGLNMYYEIPKAGTTLFQFMAEALSIKKLSDSYYMPGHPEQTFCIN